MTSQKDKIQSLIADIEQVLDTQRPKKPWVRASDMEPQRRALAKAQAYLQALQQSFDAPEGWGPVDPETGQLIPPDQSANPDADAATPATGVFSGQPAPPGTRPEDVLQSLLTEMRFLKSSALEPLRLEMDRLHQERDGLQQEVKGLEAQRSAILAASGASAGRAAAMSDEQLNEFLAVLMERLQERIAVQVNQTLGQLESDHAEAIAKLTEATDAEVLQLRPAGQSLEEMRELQTRSDQLLVNIESTLQGMYETLQKNIDSYQISLNEGIENMHSLGRQGEVIVRSLVDHLTQQLGQTAPPEPAFFPSSRSAESNLTYALADSSPAEPTDAETLPTANAVTEAVSAVSRAENRAENETEEDADDTVSSLDEILPAGSLNETSFVPVSPAALQETPESDTEAASEETNGLAPEDCIREDGTIDLDLLKLDIDRSDDENVTAEDVMIDAAIADAQVAAAEAEDPEIEAKVTPTADAAYLAELTLDDLTSIETSETETSETETSADETNSVSAFLDLDEPLSDVNSGEPLFAELTETNLTDANEGSGEQEEDEGSSGVENSRRELAVHDSDTATADAQSAEPSSARGVADANLMAAAALGAAAAAGAQRSTDSEESASEESDSEETGSSEFWDASTLESTLEVPDSAKVPDIPDAQDERPAEADARASLEIDDTVSSELAAELEADSLRADQIAASVVRSGLEAVSTLTPDLEEPIVYDEALPEPRRLSDEAEPMESSKIPDWPDETADETADEAANETLGKADAVAESEGEGEGEGEEIDAESTLNLPTAAIAPPDTSQEPPQFVDENPFEIDSSLATDSAASLETSSANETAPAAFDDNLDFFETSDSADKAADDLIEKLSTESFDDEEATAFSELPTIAPPLPDAPLSEGSLALADAPLIQTVATLGDSAQEDSAQEDSVLYDDEWDEGEDDPTDGQPASWFLGIDLGTTGLSAVLINRLGEQVYPLYWEDKNPDRAAAQADEEQANEEQYGLFRLPVVLQIAKGDEEESRTEISQIGAVGVEALHSEQALRTAKPLLKIGIPLKATEGMADGPLVQWSDHKALPLQSIQDGLTHLLSTLSPQNLRCRAINLKKSALRRILGELESVTVGYPNNWPDTYSFNIREAILAAGIVSQPDQIFFVEEAIAALLSALPDPHAELDEADTRQPSLYNCNWQGGTVVISAGATLTEAGVVDLPAELDQLIYRDFALRSFTYAGDSLDQDIICQLLHIPLKQANTESPIASGWSNLGLDQLQLPQAGEADRIKRHRLRQRLNDSQLGREALAAARDLKMVLQEETQCELTLAGQGWVVKRKDLETKVFIPYIQRVNRQINSLLNQKGLPAQAIKQVICTGGSAALSAIARWLRQKFPNATIIQDTYSGEYSNSCSRVAYGLANLCHYPNVLDTHRHQYNDYFLLLELLRILPDQPLPAGGILHLLEQRGVNIQACQSHILALIEGHLPPGLVPTEGDRPLISAQSPNIETYRALSELPLFKKQGGQIYIADEAQGRRLRKHLEGILATKQQMLSKPLAASLTAQNAS